ncbi:MAG: hypothetical protein WD988_03435 [Candidatus Curtissbacteria bacterium]
MNKTDLDQIGNLIDKKLDEKLDEKLEPLHKKLDGITNQLVEVSEGVSEIKETLESHEKRITKIEDHLGL